MKGYVLLEERTLEHKNGYNSRKSAMERVKFGFFKTEKDAESMMHVLQRIHHASNESFRNRAINRAIIGRQPGYCHPHELEIEYKVIIDSTESYVDNETTIEQHILSIEYRPEFLIYCGEASYSWGRIGNFPCSLLERYISERQEQKYKALYNELESNRCPKYLIRKVFDRFESPEDALSWLNSPSQALSGRTPIQVCGVQEFERVSALLR